MNPSTALARVLVDEALRGGLAEVVVAPGSRSTPLALAFADAAAQGLLRLHVRVDERSAGYLALGLARGSGAPVAVVTTSGTAAVNLHPAVTEAAHAGVPLLALTADRPPELRGTGANQTIDQAVVFGTDPRWAVDLGVARREPGQVRYWRSVVSRAMAVAADPADPGPVHLNVPFADPLVPDGDPAWVEPLDGRADGRPWTLDGRLTGALALPVEDALADLLDGGPVPARGLVVLGDHSDPEASALADELSDAMGWPLLSEPTGGGAGAAMALRHGPLLLAAPAFADAHVPDLVVTVGRVGLTRQVLRAVSRARLHVAVDPRPMRRLADPTRTADLVLAAVPLPTESDYVADEAWVAAWQEADAAATGAVDGVLAATPGLSGPDVARAACAAVPSGGLLVVGASWPVRHLEAYAGGGPADALVLGNRGTSGIDGTVSTAWGAALAVQAGGDPAPGPAVALLGDLALLYDSNGLLVPADEPRPDLVLVVVDNDGGGIFGVLEQGSPEHAVHFERVFGTPHGRDVAALAAAMGVPAVTVGDSEALDRALAEAAAAGGVHLVVARTIPRAEEVSLLTRVQSAVTAALAPVRH